MDKKNIIDNWLKYCICVEVDDLLLSGSYVRKNIELYTVKNSIFKSITILLN